MLWTIVKQEDSRNSRKFFLRATAQENGHDYAFIAAWDTPIYAVNIYKDADNSVENAILNLILWSDTDMEVLVPRLLSATRRNIEKQAARLERLHDSELEKPI